MVITNNYIECFTNNAAGTDIYGRDPIWIGNNLGGHTITGNTIISRDAYTNGQHPDIIQMLREGSDSNFVFTIADNLMIMDNDTSSSSQCIYMMLMYSNRMLIYNNIMMNNSIISTGITYSANNSANYLSARIFNNTIQTNAGFFAMFSVDTLIAENNIGINNASKNYMSIVLDSNLINETAYILMDYNHYYRRKGTNNYFLAPKYGSSITFESWQALGYDIHSDTGSVSFMNAFGTTSSDYRVTNFYNTGTDLSAYFTTDIEGSSRPQGSAWDKGAVEGQ